VARIWNTPIFILATVYFVVDGVFSYVTQPISAWIAKKKPFERARIWVTSMRPYPSLALFAVPVIILEPAKPLAGYLMGTGHFFAGAVTFIVAEVLMLTFVERFNLPCQIGAQQCSPRQRRQLSAQDFEVGQPLLVKIGSGRPKKTRCFS
jgi:hypothetical protein